MMEANPRVISSQNDHTLTGKAELAHIFSTKNLSMAGRQPKCMNDELVGLDPDQSPSQREKVCPPITLEHSSYISPNMKTRFPTAITMSNTKI